MHALTPPPAPCLRACLTYTHPGQAWSLPAETNTYFFLEWDRSSAHPTPQALQLCGLPEMVTLEQEPLASRAPQNAKYAHLLET